MMTLSLSDTDRNTLTHMEKGECYISGELYNKSAHRNIAVDVFGIISENYMSIRDMLPPEPQYGAPESISDDENED